MTEMIQKAFEALEWHDAVLLSVSIDRRSPGECDEVVLTVQWANEQEQKVRFIDCYALDAQMNFGVAAPESIRAARCILESPKLADMRQRWAAVGVDLQDVCCFEITTNSTASVIRVFARRIEVSDA
jgi:hypothetical protein